MLMTQNTISANDSMLKIFIDSLEHHPVFSNSYFNYLRQSSWNKNSFDIHRANFFYRTELTVKAIAHLCARAAAEDDHETLILFSHVLNEECGNGNNAHSHTVLMEKAHNLFGDSEFLLPSLRVTEAKNHPLVLSETVEYRHKLQELIAGSYPCMLGVVMALELHADKMLRVFKSAFQASRKNLDLITYQNKVEIYFNCHIENGVEERHSRDAKKCVAHNCRTRNDFTEIRRGAEEAMKYQLRMWEAIYNSIKDNGIKPI